MKRLVPTIHVRLRFIFLIVFFPGIVFTQTEDLQYSRPFSKYSALAEAYLLSDNSLVYVSIPDRQRKEIEVTKTGADDIEIQSKVFEKKKQDYFNQIWKLGNRIFILSNSNSSFYYQVINCETMNPSMEMPVAYGIKIPRVEILDESGYNQRYGVAYSPDSTKYVIYFSIDNPEGLRPFGGTCDFFVFDAERDGFEHIAYTFPKLGTNHKALQVGVNNSGNPIILERIKEGGESHFRYTLHEIHNNTTCLSTNLEANCDLTQVKLIGKESGNTIVAGFGSSSDIKAVDLTVFGEIVNQKQVWKIEPLSPDFVNRYSPPSKFVTNLSDDRLGIHRFKIKYASQTKDGNVFVAGTYFGVDAYGYEVPEDVVITCFNDAGETMFLEKLHVRNNDAVQYLLIGEKLGVITHNSLKNMTNNSSNDIDAESDEKKWYLSIFPTKFEQKIDVVLPVPVNYCNGLRFGTDLCGYATLKKPESGKAHVFVTTTLPNEILKER